MRDPYLYDDIPVLRNKLGICDQALLDDAEAGRIKIIISGYHGKG